MCAKLKKLYFDVLVCGGGTAGSVAAIRAARLGLKTALIERHSQLGGTSTIGMVTPVMANRACGQELLGGIHRELHNELSGMGLGDTYGIDPVYAAITLEKFAADAGVEILYHTELISVEQSRGHINSVDVISLGKRFEISASYFIDATGDALLAYMAGEPVSEGNEKTGEHQPLSLRFMLSDVDVPKAMKYLRKNSPKGERDIWPCGEDTDFPTWSIHPKWLEKKASRLSYFKPWKNQLMFSFYTVPGRRNSVSFNSPRVLCDNPADPKELSKAYIDGRKQIPAYLRFFRENVPGFEHAYIDFIAQLIGIRECRRIVGDFILTERHVRNLTHFEDGICLCNYPIDIHHNADRGATLFYLPADEWYEIPYAALLPKRADNLIIAGRCISSDFVAHSSYRIIPICRALGEAAAYACGFAKRMKCSLKEVDGHKLRNQLIKDGVLVIPQTV